MNLPLQPRILHGCGTQCKQTRGLIVDTKASDSFIGPKNTKQNEVSRNPHPFAIHGTCLDDKRFAAGHVEYYDEDAGGSKNDGSIHHDLIRIIQQ
jgi:hypothetical protein